MPAVHVYRLEPRSAFHFGERGVGLEETAETFRSDSLFSALCSVVREGWGTERVEALLRAFLERPEPPFRLSSCFPYAGEVLFFPRPMLALAGQPAAEAAKRLKNTRFVSHGLFARWVAGDDLERETEAANFLSESHAWVSAAERAKLAGILPQAGGAEAERRALWAKTEVPRVTVDRASSASLVYRCGRLAFRPGCGLYFLVEWRDEAWRGLLEQALRALGDAGLGGRRSAGYGQFEPRLPAEGLELAAADRPGALLTLALYWPTAEEVAAGVLGGPARYDLVSRYGWMWSPDGRALRRRQVRMVAEGSLLAPVHPALGALADVTPRAFAAHRVYRYGLAFPLGVSVAGGGHG